MSLRDGQRLLRWNAVMAALEAAGLDEETVDMVKSARVSGDTVNAFVDLLIGSADTKAAKNYVKVDVVGLIAPFERAYVELIRPGGKSSHELREMMRVRLLHLKECLSSSNLKFDAFKEGMISGINETLEAEKP